MDRVSSAIAAVYAAFADAPRPASIDGCPCCIDDNDTHVLLSTPPGELEPDAVAPYASSVFLTVGSKPDFFYLLPRILEIVATEPHWWPEPEVIGRSIRDSGYAQWPKERQDAVHRYFDAVFERTLHLDDDVSALESWLCMLGRAGLDLRPYFERVLDFPNQTAQLFATFNNMVSPAGALGGFWEDVPDSTEIVKQWIRSEPVRRIVHEQWGVTL
jgi:hypothetical protein